MNRFIKRARPSRSLVAFLLALAILSAKDSVRAADLDRSDVDQILVKAREAMAVGKLDLADRLVTQAEEAKIRYPMLHFGDTPARVRSDLKDLLSGKAAPQPAAQPKSLAGDRYANTSTSAPYPSTAAARVSSQLAASEEAQVSPREASDAALLNARKALAVGDAVQASRLNDEARSYKIAYLPEEDSPEQVALSIAEFRRLEGARSNETLWRDGYAKFLVAQANALIRWGEIESAERAANEASNLYAANGTPSNEPAGVMAKIQRLRQGMPAEAPTDGRAASLAEAKARTLELLAEARKALGEGNLPLAKRIAAQASQFNVAEAQFAETEDSPARLATELMRVDQEQASVALASSTYAVDLSQPSLGAPSARLAAIPDEAPRRLPVAAEEVFAPEASAEELMHSGEQALRGGEREKALELFRAAYAQRNELDPASQDQLQDHLQMLSGTPALAAPGAGGGSLLNSADAGGRVVAARQLSAEIGKRQSEAARLRESNPQGSLDLLLETQQMITSAQVDLGTKEQLQRRVGLSIAETEKYISDHQAEIDLDNANQAVLDDIERSRAVRQEVQQRMAELIDQFNTLRDEQRYGEMEIVAKRLHELAPQEQVAQQLWEQAKFIRRTMLNKEIDDLTESGVMGVLQDLKKTAGEGLRDANTPMRFDPKYWEQIAGRTPLSSRESQRTAREMEIQRKLRTPVLLNYNEMPLTQVVDELSKLADINIHLDPRGLGQEGVRSDATVTLNLSQEVKLESALNLILEPLHLTYMIKDEVLKITSEQIRDGDLQRVVYPVADLVIPIPNFVPSPSMGLQGLINDAYAAMPIAGRNAHGPVSYVPTAVGPAGPGGMNPNILPQQLGSGTLGSDSPQISGPGGLGGAAQADFDSLIDLIVSTVEHDSWMENGTGEGEIQPFPTNLSLVISQTERVHEQIADLLEQLRRLQDLQVTIEVRFIRLTDSFFERIGIDFDFNIEDGSGIADLTTGTPTFEPNRNSATVGVSTGTGQSLGVPLPTFTADLDIPFRQNSFGLNTPQFGTPQDVGQFGFAILSDIEAFFLINASQGDNRANVLQAPKVTLFNGQQAVVIDSAFTPFVISVVPVVGEFAAAQQPVIVVLSEGTMMTVQAVVSDDRRYVRLTLVPFFSQIGEVNTFTFEGSETTSTSSNTTDQDDDGTNESDDNSDTVTRTGTTVQLPTFEVITVSTTVSVPDGGTVLLGGIKRLREGRSEFGVPLLAKLPYIDRLFRNVGIGRDSDSLMMMVTPHIIIQEEEEERLGFSPDE